MSAPDRPIENPHGFGQVINRLGLFFVSHNERDLLRFCTRGLYLDKGSLMLDGPIKEVVKRYNADYGV